MLVMADSFLSGKKVTDRDLQITSKKNCGVKPFDEIILIIIGIVEAIVWVLNTLGTQSDVLKSQGYYKRSIFINAGTAVGRILSLEMKYPAGHF